MNSLYTEDVERLIYNAKPRLEKYNFKIKTFDMGYFIKIMVYPDKFDWRTVEERLAIALELERLRQLIEETGIRCVIEKPEENEPNDER